MSKNAFIFHGTAGYPEENWFPWMKAKLEENELKVFVPQFPTPQGQSLAAWLEVMHPLMDQINSDTILIGHSLGGVFTLKLLERFSVPIKLAVLVGTPIGVRPILNYDRDASFSGFDFDWQKIKASSKNFLVYQSDNDPYVGLENGKQLANYLGVELTFIPNAGHFNAKAGYIEFEHLLQSLKSYL